MTSLSLTNVGYWRALPGIMPQPAAGVKRRLWSWGGDVGLDLVILHTVHCWRLMKREQQRREPCKL